jgi:hypothetical protein
VLTELQAALAQEVQLLQKRLALLGSKAAVIVDELVQLQAAANNKLAEWQQHWYVAECSAVAALERVVKAAAAAGQPLPHDLRLEVRTHTVFRWDNGCCKCHILQGCGQLPVTCTSQPMLMIYSMQLLFAWHPCVVTC